MKKSTNWGLIIGALMLGVFIGFMTGESYERNRIINMEIDLTKKEANAAHEKSQRFLDSLKLKHPELFKDSK